MICACTHQDCYYIFEVEGSTVPEQCPDCGNRSVRPADPKEVLWFYLEHRKEPKAG